MKHQTMKIYFKQFAKDELYELWQTWEDSIKMVHKETAWQAVDCIFTLVQDRNEQQALMNMVYEPRGAATYREYRLADNYYILKEHAPWGLFKKVYIIDYSADQSQ